MLARSRFPFAGAQTDPVGRCCHIEPRHVARGCQVHRHISLSSDTRILPRRRGRPRGPLGPQAFFLRRRARYSLAFGPRGAAHLVRCLRCLPGVSGQLNTGHFSPDLHTVTGFPVFTVLYFQNYGTRKIPTPENRPDRLPPLPFWAVMRADSAELIPGYTVKRRICRDAPPPRRLPWAFCQPFTRART